jgi:hypothetical protein
MHDEFFLRTVERELDQNLHNEDTLSAFVKAPAGSFLHGGATTRTPDDFFEGLWHRGEVACLFGDSNVGKSILAFQIAADIAATGQKVLFYDFEHSDDQFRLRYSNPRGDTASFPSDLWRETINFDSDHPIVGEDILRFIEADFCHSMASVIVIDNLSCLCPPGDADAARRVMLTLLRWKQHFGLSVLVVAHTPKRSPSRPVLPSDLAGAKCIFNFFDSVFALAASAASPGLCYIKQLKSRFGEILYDASAVRLCRIERFLSDCFPMFALLPNTASEQAQLRRFSKKQLRSIIASALKMRAAGSSLREIASALSISKSYLAEKLGPSAPSALSAARNQSVTPAPKASRINDDSTTGTPVSDTAITETGNATDITDTDDCESACRDHRRQSALAAWRLNPLAERDHLCFDDPDNQLSLLHPHSFATNLAYYVRPYLYSFMASTSLHVFHGKGDTPSIPAHPMRCGALIFDPVWHRLGRLSHSRVPCYAEDPHSPADPYCSHSRVPDQLERGDLQQLQHRSSCQPFIAP